MSADACTPNCWFTPAGCCWSTTNRPGRFTAPSRRRPGALTDDACHVAVSYSGVAVSLAGEAPALMPVRELRYNTAVQARVHAILEQVRRGELEPAAALAQLGRVEADTPRHSRWVAVLVLGAAAASLAGLLGADAGAVAVAGLATGLGLLARQELGRRHFSLLALPLTAAFIGAVLGGLAIRLGWTRTPELVLIVPALMLVPGPHLINGVLDLIDNYLPMSLARLGLAAGILLASALGIVLGVELTLPDPLLPEQGASADRLNLASDMVLAGIVTCGFAVFYNTAWRRWGWRPWAAWRATASASWPWRRAAGWRRRRSWAASPWASSRPGWPGPARCPSRSSPSPAP